MAECSYARCAQERRFIKRELQKWNRDMVHIVGLERIAEELMGCRKWKLYQEVLARSHSNLTITPDQINNITVTDVHCNKDEQNSATQQQSIQNSTRAADTANKQHQQNTQTNTTEQTILLNDRNNTTGTINSDKDNTNNLISKENSDIESAGAKAGDSSYRSNNIHGDQKDDQERVSTPIDWKPQENCYFCVDGKLLTVNDKGDLVAESGSVNSEPELANRTVVESDSDSSDCSEQENTNYSLINNTNKTVPSVADLLRNSLLQPNMTSFESMTAQLATIASLNGLYPGLIYNPFLPQMHSNASTTTEPTSADSPNTKPSSSPVDMNTEQPLDLSAKPTATSAFPNDPKQVFRAKPRISTVVGRKTYTEEELQNALEAILSGKLGTRRAAVLYGIPRSTLRNKVYKLAMEQKREANLLNEASVLDALDDDDDDKELSGDEDDKAVPRWKDDSLVTPDDMLPLSASRSSSTAATLQKFFENCSPKAENMPSTQLQQSNKSQTSASTSSSPPIANHPWLSPDLFSNLLLAGGFMQHKYDDPTFRELLQNLLIRQQEFIKEQLKSSVNETTPTKSTVDHINNGSTLNAHDLTPQTTPPLHSRSPQAHLSADISPPTNRQNNDSQSPPIPGIGSKGMLSLRDVIAKSINRTFSQQNAEALNKPSIDHLDQYKRPSISVIKNLGGTDLSSGKGTRPKRGKYRNYDRDSLVEAVKAVQRGEMSVHRAGSYYGVPHSTLEYKVKERHLMRPRKREPKPQPLENSGGSTSSISSVKSHDLLGAGSRGLDKSKSSLSTAKTPMKTPPFPPTSENGIKMGLFDPSQLPYPPQLFWPPASGFSGLPLASDFAQRSSGASGAPFAGNAESFAFAQQMMRFQEDALRSNASNSNNKSETPAGDLLALNKKSKNDRELTLDNLYDGSANGSFLDGIIRHSLDRKPDSIRHGALLDQLLVKSNRQQSGGSGSSNLTDSANSNNKRTASPFGYVHHAIKRERINSSSERDSVERDVSKESSESLLKYRDSLTTRMDDKHAKDLSEDVNGTTPDNKSNRNTEAEDSS